ncbi:MAG: septum formation initiator family protein [Brotaphodocola sp.]
MNGRNGARRGRKDRWGNRLAIIGITLVVFSLGVVVNLRSASMKKRDLEYQAKEQSLLKQVEQEEKRADELEEYRVYVQTKQYIEEVAKQKLGLVKPDEILLKPVPKD